MKQRGFVLWWRGWPRLRVASFGFRFISWFALSGNGFRIGSWTVLWW